MVSSLPSALAIHTTSPSLGLCAYHPNYGITSKTWDLGRAMSTQLHHRLSEFLQPEQWSDLELIAVAIGPGGFTSTRMGVVLARTLAQQLNVPLVGVSSLAAFAWHHAIAPLLPSSHESLLSNENVLSTNEGAIPEDLALPTIAVQMPARRNQIFGAIYQPSRAPLPPNDLGNTEGQGDRPTHRPEMLKNQNISWVALHPDQVMDQDEWQRHINQPPSPPNCLCVEGSLGHTVEALLDLAYIHYFSGAPSHWSTVYPFYGQSPV